MSEAGTPSKRPEILTAQLSVVAGALKATIPLAPTSRTISTKTAVWNEYRDRDPFIRDSQRKAMEAASS